MAIGKEIVQFDIRTYNKKIEEIVKKLISKGKEVILCLEIIEKNVSEHHKNSNIAKTVGTTVNGLGLATTVVGICLVPVTLGMSLGLTIGGLATSLAGSLTTAGTEITKEVLINKERNKIATKLNEYSKYKTELQEMYNQMEAAFTEHNNNNNGQWRNFFEYINDPQVHFGLSSVALNVARLFLGITFADFGANVAEIGLNAAGIGFDIGGAGVLGAGQASRVAKAGAVVGVNAVRIAGVAIGAALFVVDTAFVIKDWIVNNKLSTEIKKHIEILNEEIAHFENNILSTSSAPREKIMSE